MSLRTFEFYGTRLRLVIASYIADDDGVLGQRLAISAVKRVSDPRKHSIIYLCCTAACRQGRCGADDGSLSSVKGCDGHKEKLNWVRLSIVFFFPFFIAATVFLEGKHGIDGAMVAAVQATLVDV